MRVVNRAVSGVAACLAVAGIGVAVPGAVAATAPQSPWAQSNADAAHSRANRAESTLTTATVARIRSLRTVTAPPQRPDDFCSDRPYVAPVLSGGAMYTVRTSMLTKFSAATGAVLWHVNPDPDLTTYYTSVSVVGGLALVAGGDCLSQSDPNAFVAAYDAQTGKPEWTTSGGPGLFDMVASGGFVVTLGSTAGSGTNFTVRLLTTGAVVWTRHYSNECVVDGNVLVVRGLVVHDGCTAAGTSFLAADRLANGTRVWTRSGGWTPQAGDLDSTAGLHVLAADQGEVVRDLNPATGATRHTLNGAVEVLSVGPARVFATCGAAATQVCGYDRASGARQWHVELSQTIRSAALAGGVLYLADGSMRNVGTGAVIRRLWSGTASSVLVGDGRVAVIAQPRVLTLYGLPGS